MEASGGSGFFKTGWESEALGMVCGNALRLQVTACKKSQVLLFITKLRVLRLNPCLLELKG